MKKLTILFLITVFVCHANAGIPDKEYTKTMKVTIAELYKSGSVDEFNAVVNKFTRIGEAEKNKWRPWYYASYGSLMKAIMIMNGDKSDMDLHLDEAQGHLDKAMAMEPSNAELIALQGYIHMIRVTVDPATRGQQYSGRSMQALGKALAIDPENPRAMMLMGQMQIGTSQFFGQPPTRGCEMVSESLVKFEAYEPSHELDPTWGRDMAESIAVSCSGQ